MLPCLILGKKIKSFTVGAFSRCLRRLTIPIGDGPSLCRPETQKIMYYNIEASLFLNTNDFILRMHVSV